MNMIAHPAVGMDACAKAYAGLGDTLIQQVAISVTKEYWLPMIAPKRHVVEAAWNMKARAARHRPGP
jgi:hypothetical protein